jgi:hypothetical protein
MPRTINLSLLPFLRTAQFIFALGSLAAILVYFFNISQGTFRNLHKSAGPLYYLISSVVTVAILLGYLILAYCVKKHWIKRDYTKCKRRLLSIGCTSFLTAQWTVAIFVMVPVAIDACLSNISGTETEKLQFLILKYSIIAAVAISCMITLLMIISLVLLIVIATEKDLFNTES